MAHVRGEFFVLTVADCGRITGVPLTLRNPATGKQDLCSAARGVRLWTGQDGAGRGSAEASGSIPLLSPPELRQMIPPHWACAAHGPIR
jgi:hypothetical protein